MEQDIEKENRRLRDLLYDKIMFIEQLKKDYRTLVKDIEEITKNYNEARDLAIKLRDAHETVRKEFLRADKNKDMWREKAEKYHTTLQEIKAIVVAPKPFIDFSVTKTAIEVEYDYVAICNELELRLHKVLELVTKAEEE